MIKNLKAALTGLGIVITDTVILLISMFLFESFETLFSCRGYCPSFNPLIIIALPFLFIFLVASLPILLIEKIIGTNAFPPFPGEPFLNIPDFLIDITVIGIIAACVSIAISIFNQRPGKSKT